VNLDLIVGFLANTVSHLNDLNVKLQVEKDTIHSLISIVHVFQKQMDVFQRNINDNYPIFQDFCSNVKMKQLLNYSIHCGSDEQLCTNH